MKHNTVTVITPTYNRSNMLVRAIESVLCQTRLPDEYIIIDDGSTDNTKDVVAPYLMRYSFIRYIYQENKGESYAAQRAWELSTGDFVFSLCDDDWLSPDHIERHVDALVKNPNAVLAYADYAMVYSDRTINTANGFVSKERFLSTLVPNIVVGCMVNKKRYGHDLGYYRDVALKTVSDCDFYLRACLLGDFVYVPYVTYFWLLHDKSSTQSQQDFILSERFFWVKDALARPSLKQYVANRCLLMINEYPLRAWRLRKKGKYMKALMCIVSEWSWRCRYAVFIISNRILGKREAE